MQTSAHWLPDSARFRERRAPAFRRSLWSVQDTAAARVLVHESGPSRRRLAGRWRGESVYLLEVLTSEVAAPEEQPDRQAAGVEEPAKFGRDEHQRRAYGRGPLRRDDVLGGGRGFQFEHVVFDDGCDFQKAMRLWRQIFALLHRSECDYEQK